MNIQLLLQQNPAFRPELATEEIRTTFYKCLRWQVEETLDPINCPYHYFCDSNYPGNYPSYIDFLVLLFATASYLATLVIMVIDLSRRRKARCSRLKRFLLPSGPVSLPITLLALAKGNRINSIFPLSHIGPAILKLLQVSALAFDHDVDKDVRYAIYGASTISGLLHASMYLDSIILPYYTGFDALVSSTFSGECKSCVCRTEALVAGGRLVKYRGLSITAFLVSGTLCSRIICRAITENRSMITAVKHLLESLGWILITLDCIYLTTKAPPEQSVQQTAACGSILVLICLHMVKKLSSQITQWTMVQEKFKRPCSSD